MSSVKLVDGWKLPAKITRNRIIFTTMCILIDPFKVNKFPFIAIDTNQKGRTLHKYTENMNKYQKSQYR